MRLKNRDRSLNTSALQHDESKLEFSQCDLNLSQIVQEPEFLSSGRFSARKPVHNPEEMNEKQKLSKCQSASAIGRKRYPGQLFTLKESDWTAHSRNGLQMKRTADINRSQDQKVYNIDF